MGPPPSLVQVPLHPDQEMVSQEDERHMVVPAPPGAEFVLVEPDLPCAFLNTRLDGPPHATAADQRDSDGRTTLLLTSVSRSRRWVPE